jgi:hypothetical protein
LDDEAVYLVPIGSGRFELYTEPADDAEPGSPADEHGGFWRRSVQRLHERWRQTVRDASAEDGAAAAEGRFGRARDWIVRRIAESIAEQRTLWSLRGIASASFVYPDDLTEASATAVKQQLLLQARRHHGRWLLVNAVGVAATAVLVVLPGPNVIGYYFAFRLISHYLSWRGARQALDSIVWRPQADPILSEFGSLASLSRDSRAERVAALSAQLHVPQLADFFDRVACAAR